MSLAQRSRKFCTPIRQFAKLHLCFFFSKLVISSNIERLFPHISSKFMLELHKLHQFPIGPTLDQFVILIFFLYQPQRVAFSFMPIICMSYLVYAFSSLLTFLPPFFKNSFLLFLSKLVRCHSHKNGYIGVI